jgi:hypothetical protein
MNALADGALELADLGVPVLPVETRGKRPLTAHGYKDATSDPATVESRWTRWPAANVAIRTGDGLAVLDVDPRHGGDRSLRDLIAAHGPLPDTAAAVTGGGGSHYYFRTRRPTRTADLAPGLDLRADGAYVVAPPSIHSSGGLYDWLAPLAETPLAELPGWLATAPNPAPRPPRAEPGGAADFLRRQTPPRYVTELCGVPVHGPGKIRCPLPDHPDRTPSCHVYATADEGWHCYGCKRGGDIYTLAALLTGRTVPLRGADFAAVEDLLLSFYETRLGVRS